MCVVLRCGLRNIKIYSHWCNCQFWMFLGRTGRPKPEPHSAEKLRWPDRNILHRFKIQKPSNKKKVTINLSEKIPYFYYYNQQASTNIFADIIVNKQFLLIGFSPHHHSYWPLHPWILPWIGAKQKIHHKAALVWQYILPFFLSFMYKIRTILHKKYLKK